MKDKSKLKNHDNAYYYEQYKDKRVFCEFCKKEVRYYDFARHKKSNIHIRNEMTKHSIDELQKVISDFAEKVKLHNSDTTTQKK